MAESIHHDDPSRNIHCETADLRELLGTSAQFCAQPNIGYSAPMLLRLSETVNGNALTRDDLFAETVGRSTPEKGGEEHDEGSRQGSSDPHGSPLESDPPISTR